MINLINQDNLSFLQQQPDHCYDMVLTSPPYNINIPYDGYDDSLAAESYWKHIESVLCESYRCLRPTGRMAINIMPNSQINMPTHSRITGLLESLGAVWITEIIWDKGGVNRWFPRGTYGSAVKPWFQHSFEYIVIVGKGSSRREAPGPGDLTNTEYTHWTTPLWRIQPETSMKQYGHPAMFPEELVERLVKLFSWPGDHILDPWAGTGTTAVVACKLNRSATCLEQSLRYHQIAEQRIQYEQHWNALFDTMQTDLDSIQ